MIERIINYLIKNNIEYTGVIPFDECKIINSRLLTFTPKSVVVFLVPYYTGTYEPQNISKYAVPRDYHIFFRDLFSGLEREFADIKDIDGIIKGFSDHSPIDEVNAAAKTGLGIIGENGLLINESYGSYVFIGEIFTDIKTEKTNLQKIHFCPGCGACRENCPSPDLCLSALTQKKGVLASDEQLLIKKYGCGWGCDICQNICPCNRDARETPVGFFRTELIPYLNTEMLDSMSDAEFGLRAYSWRKRETIKRNLKILNREHI